METCWVCSRSEYWGKAMDMYRVESDYGIVHICPVCAGLLLCPEDCIVHSWSRSRQLSNKTNEEAHVDRMARVRQSRPEDFTCDKCGGKLKAAE